MPNKVAEMPETVKIVFIGDIVSRAGRQAISEYLPLIRKEHEISLVIGNAENAAGGTGLTPHIIDELLDCGLDVMTSGNHIWRKKEVIEELNTRPYVIRPANYPEGTPGLGYCRIEANGVSIGVVNLCGRVFMAPIDCPFRVGVKVIEEIKQNSSVIIVDMHAEATSEKQALGWYLDGRVSAVIGTHTHIQTSDARILPRGTAYITDAGMTGPSESVLGIKKEIIIKRFLTNLPQKFEVAKNYPQLEGVILEIDARSGKARSIQAFHYADKP